MEQKIHVESRHQGFVRLAPLRDQYRLRICGIQKIAHVLPQFYRLHTSVIVLHQRTRHIHAESIAALREPENHNILHCLAGRQSLRRVYRALPRLAGIGKAIVQRRLIGEKIDGNAAVSRIQSAQRTGYPFIVRRIFPNRVCPDVSAPVFIGLVCARLPKPGMLRGSMSRHQIKDNMHVADMGLLKQTYQILVRPIARRHLTIIRHIISRISERRQITGIQPEGVASQIADIVQFFDNAGDITYAVSVAVIKALRVDFIKNTLIHRFSYII